MKALIQTGLTTACVFSASMLGCKDEGTAPETGDMAMSAPDLAELPSSDMPLSNPDLTGASAPVKVTGFMQPASAHWDPVTSAWYVSNVVSSNVTDPRTLNDNMAFISKVPANLMNPDHNFFSGTAATKMSAPFGIRVANGKLYAGDINKLWSIDLANPTGTGTIQSGTVMAGGLAGLAGYPAFLIDVALDASNNIYAADATGGRLLKWSAPFAAGAMPTVIVAADTFAGPSGVYVDNTKVVIAEAGINMVVMKNGGISTCNLDGSNRSRLFNSTKNSIALQGIEKDGNRYMIGSPADKVVYTLPDTGGQLAILRNVALDGGTTATDIGWDPASKTLAVPDTGANAVYFYKL